MSQKLRRYKLLLPVVLGFSLTVFGCSSSTPSASNTQTNGQPTVSATTPSPNSTNAAGQTSPSATAPGLDSTTLAQQPTPTASAQPGSAQDFYQQGIASVQKGDFNGAEQAWRKSIELDPKNPKVHSNLGVLLQNQGKVDEATQQYQEAIRLDPKDAETHVKLAIALGQQRKLDESITQSKEALRLQPDFAPAHVVLAAALSGQGKQDEAVASLQKAKDIFKKQGKTDALADVQIKLAVALAQQRKLDDAIAQLKEVTTLKPDFAPAHVLLAGAFSDQGKKDEALASLQKARDLFKTQGKTDALAETQINLAVLLGQQNKIDDSVTQAKEAVALKPDSAKAHYILAMGLSSQGKRDEALASLTTARDLLKTQGKTEEADKIDQLIKQASTKK